MPSRRDYDPFGPARTEARCLTCLVEHGTSVETVRDLISISPEVETELRRDAARHPQEAERILAMIAWRRQVLPEFDRLLQEAHAGMF